MSLFNVPNLKIARENYPIAVATQANRIFAVYAVNSTLFPFWVVELEPGDMQPFHAPHRFELRSEAFRMFHDLLQTWC